jgi:hypothetical protein
VRRFGIVGGEADADGATGDVRSSGFEVTIT